MVFTEVPLHFIAFVLKWELGARGVERGELCAWGARVMEGCCIVSLSMSPGAGEIYLGSSTESRPCAVCVLVYLSSWLSNTGGRESLNPNSFVLLIFRLISESFLRKRGCFCFRGVSGDLLWRSGTQDPALAPGVQTRRASCKIGGN